MIRFAPIAFAAALLSMVCAPPAAAQLEEGSWAARLTGPAAAERLTTGTADERRQAAATLGERGDPGRAVTALMEALPTERDPAIRRAIVRALARRGDSKAVPVLVGALGSGDRAGRDAVASALAGIGTGPAVRALVGALDESQTAPAAATALARVGAPALPLLTQALQQAGASPLVPRILAEIGSPLAVPALIERASADRPAMRLAVVRALGVLGDDRAVRAVVDRVADPSSEVAHAALDALGRLGGLAEAELLVERVREGPESQRRAALAALLRVAPARGAAVLTDALGDRPSAGPRALRTLAVRWPQPALVPLLGRLLQAGDLRAADALAEVEGGEGLPALVRIAGEGLDEGSARAVSRALAVAVRRWPRSAPPGAVDALRRAAGGGTRGLTLRALARDPSVGREARTGLTDGDPLRRAAAADALALLAEPAHGRAVREALATERDAEVFRALARAALALGVPVRAPTLWRWMRSPATAPEAMALAARSLEGVLPRSRRRFRELLRRRLRSAHPRVRVGAARALAEARDRQAWRALASRLDDPMPEVRHAVARSLGALAVPAAVNELEARARVEGDPRVWRALEGAVSAATSGAPRPFVLRGDQVFRVRIATAEVHRSVRVDVVLPDARWMRLRTLPSGELFIAGLPAGMADVRVRVGP